MIDMVKNFLSPFVNRMTLLSAAILAIGYVAYAHQASSMLLRADPDVIPTNPELMRYAARGKSIYRSHCLSCHHENGAGDPSRGVPVLSDTDWLYGTGLVSDIERIVTYGIRSDNPKGWNLAEMPAFARPRPSAANAAIVPLSPAQISDVVEFLNAKQHRPATVDAANRGAVVYNGVGGCYDCHSPDAKGDEAIGAPNLIDDVTLYGNGDGQSLYDSVANGRHGICPAWITVLSPLSIREVTLYVYTLSHPASQ